MNWNYLGIDLRPPKHTQVLMLLSDGTTVLSDKPVPMMLAWAAVPPVDPTKIRCQHILRGMPDELRMISPICANETTHEELCTALENYYDEELASFVDLVRVLFAKSHNGFGHPHRRKTDHGSV